MRPQINGREALFARKLEERQRKQTTEQTVDLEGPGTTALSAWFLGPKAENEALLRKLMIEAVASHCGDRRAYFPKDPVYVTEERKTSNEHRKSVAQLKRQFRHLLDSLRGSTPFWSYRWQSHMNWDLTLPSIAGYFAAMVLSDFRRRSFEE